ncbi:protein SPIRAL1-like 3 [Pyrus communis]
MGRGVSSGGGESSLGYLFGGGEETQNPVAKRGAAPQNEAPVPTAEPPAQRATAPAPPAEVNKEIPAGVPGNTSNNYFRADGQNCGNFITDRPSTKVHSAPGGGSSLDYLFGGGGGGK